MDTLNFNDKRYVVLRVIKIETLDDDEVLRYRDYCHADTVLKREGRYFFCNEITEVEPIKEEKTPEPIKTPEQ